MPKFKPIKAVELIKLLKKSGFEIIRQKGSHVFLRHADGRTTLIPIHSSEMLDGGLLLKIIKEDLKISREEFEKLS